jgi:hypothetical protein
LATTEDERQQLAREHEAHMKLIFADRSTDDRANKLAQASAKAHSQIIGRVLKIDIDGFQT